MRRMGSLLVSALLASVLASCGGADEARVVAYFEDVGDLVDRATVQVADVKVGSVEKIEMVNEGGLMQAKVTMSVDPDLKIPGDGLGAVVRQTSLLGEQFIELVPSATGPPFAGGTEVVVPLEMTERRVDVETFLADLAGLVTVGGLEDLNRFTHAQAMILQGRGEKFGRTLGELEKFTGVLSRRRDDLAGAIDSLGSAAGTLSANRATLFTFLDSLDEANALLADQAGDLVNVFRSLSSFGEFNAEFLARHEKGISRQFKAIRPIFRGLASAEKDLRVDIAQLDRFFRLFPQAAGGGPGSRGEGDYIQAEAVLCEDLTKCNTRGEKGKLRRRDR